jgi:hypothetical protein
LLALVARLNESASASRSKWLKSTSDLSKRLSVVDVMDLVVVEAVDAVVEMARVAEAMDLSAVAVVTDPEVVDVVVVMVPIEVLHVADHEVVDPALPSTRTTPMLSQALAHRTLQGQPYASFRIVGDSIWSCWHLLEGSRSKQKFPFIWRRKDSRRKLWIVVRVQPKSNHACQSYGWNIHELQKKIEFLSFIWSFSNSTALFCNQDLRFVVVTRILFRGLWGRQDCIW